LIDLPTTRAEVQALINAQVQESLHLDYKDSRALRRDKASEIAKDVSAFANADGGIMIYGVTEAKHVPEKIDEGVDHHKLSHEWLEQIIRSHIMPRIEGLLIAPIRLSPDKSIYAVYIPKSYRGPHQEMDSKEYFKRYDFSSVPMDDYEINDIRNRRQVVPPLINIDTEIRRGVMISFRVTNIGALPAEDVT
jgi:predicted HTH transcriptional regulator